MFRLEYDDCDYSRYKKQLYEWGNFIFCMLGSSYPFKDERLNKYYLDLIFYGRCKPSYLIHEMLTLMEKQKGESIETLDSFKEGMKLIRRKDA